MSYILLAILHGSCILNTRTIDTTKREESNRFSASSVNGSIDAKSYMFFEKIETCEFQYMIVDGALTLNCYCTGYS